MCVTWLRHVCEFAGVCVRPDPDMCVIWFVYVCNKTRSCVWHDSVMCVTWLSNVCDMIRPLVWHDSCACARVRASWRSETEMNTRESVVTQRHQSERKTTEYTQTHKYTHTHTHMCVRVPSYSVGCMYARLRVWPWYVCVFVSVYIHFCIIRKE